MWISKFADKKSENNEDRLNPKISFFKVVHNIDNARLTTVFIYRAFHRFRQAKIAYSGLVLDSSQFSLLPQLPQKMTLASQVVKID